MREHGGKTVLNHEKQKGVKRENISALLVGGKKNRDRAGKSWH